VLDLCWTKVRNSYPFFVFFTSLGARRASPEERFHGLHGCPFVHGGNNVARKMNPIDQWERIHTQLRFLVFFISDSIAPLILRDFTQEKKNTRRLSLVSYHYPLFFFISSHATCRLLCAHLPKWISTIYECSTRGIAHEITRRFFGLLGWNQAHLGGN